MEKEPAAVKRLQVLPDSRDLKRNLKNEPKVITSINEMLREQKGDHL